MLQKHVYVFHLRTKSTFISHSYNGSIRTARLKEQTIYALLLDMTATPEVNTILPWITRKRILWQEKWVAPNVYYQVYVKIIKKNDKQKRIVG